MNDELNDTLKPRVFMEIPELPSSEDIESILTTDPLVLAEKITGKSYKADKETELLGLGFHITHNQYRTQVLESVGDTTFSNKLDRYLRIVNGMGFKEALRLPFTGTGYSDKPTDELFYIFVHPTKGLMLHFDTFGGDYVNGSSLKFSWRPNEGRSSEVRYSGGWESESDPKWRFNEKYFKGGKPEDSYLVGELDGREALKHHVKQLEINGTLLSPWPKYEKRFMWLLHYMDTKDENYDHEAITTERIAMFPDWARAIINM